MRRVFPISLLLVALSVSIGLTAASSPQIIVLAHVTEVDVAAGRTLTDVSVTIAGNRITDVSPSSIKRSPSHAQVIDATGKFLIPGLWDMHVHWYEKDYLPLFFANGITGVRQMIGGPIHREWRRETESGSLIAPRMLIPANLDGPGSPSSWVSVGNDMEARQAVQTAKREGADFIKVYSHLPRDAFFAISDESRKLGISFAGHVPESVSAEEASDAGIKSIEHLTGFLNAVAPGLDELRRLQREIAQSGAPVPWDRVRQVWKTAKDSYSPAREEALLTRFKRNHTWQTPTLTEERGSFVYDAAWLDDPRLRYLPPTMAADWKQWGERLKARLPEQADFQTWMYVLGIGTPCDLKLMRDGKPMNVTVTIESRAAAAKSS